MSGREGPETNERKGILKEYENLKTGAPRTDFVVLPEYHILGKRRQTQGRAGGGARDKKRKGTGGNCSDD